MPKKLKCTIKKDLNVSQEDWVAVIGIGARVPGLAREATLEDLRFFLKEGKSSVKDIPEDRWDKNKLFNKDPDHLGTMTLKNGSFIDNIRYFDAQFFNISSDEADRMDPQQRILLETSYRTVENSGIKISELRGSDTGVFIGISNVDYRKKQFSVREQIDYLSGTGNALSIAANRISYQYDWQGPSLAIDTACSSSLVAIQQACDSIRNKQCDLALAGGVNLILNPDLNIAFSQARMLSPDGKCKSFDAEANGYGRGEGCGLVLLESLPKAMVKEHKIYGVIRGGAINQDGRTNGLTAPNGPSQIKVIQAALSKAKVDPIDVSLIEAHGTGTPLGDLMEFNSLRSVYDSLGNNNDSKREKILLGSVKTNFGHLEAAAGVIGFIKTILSVYHGEFYPHLHFKSFNPSMNLQDNNIKISKNYRKWNQKSENRISGISSFGFGGTNAHLIVSGFHQRENGSLSEKFDSRPGITFKKTEHWFYNKAVSLPGRSIAGPGINKNQFVWEIYFNGSHPGFSLHRIENGNILSALASMEIALWCAPSINPVCSKTEIRSIQFFNPIFIKSSKEYEVRTLAILDSEQDPIKNKSKINIESYRIEIYAREIHKKFKLVSISQLLLHDTNKSDMNTEENEIFFNQLTKWQNNYTHVGKWNNISSRDPHKNSNGLGFLSLSSVFPEFRPDTLSVLKKKLKGSWNYDLNDLNGIFEPNHSLRLLLDVCYSYIPEIIPDTSPLETWVMRDIFSIRIINSLKNIQEDSNQKSDTIKGFKWAGTNWKFSFEATRKNENQLEIDGAIWNEFDRGIIFDKMTFYKIKLNEISPNNSILEESSDLNELSFTPDSEDIDLSSLHYKVKNKKYSLRISPLHNIDWQSIFSTINQNVTDAPNITQSKIKSISNNQILIDLWAIYYIQLALDTLSKEKVIDLYKPLYKKWLKDQANQWADLFDGKNIKHVGRKPKKGIGSSHEPLIHRCGKELINILQGSINPIDLLFPGGSFKETESLYSNSPGITEMYDRFTQTILQVISKKQGLKKQKLRILEIGAGTGGLTQYIVKRIAPFVETYIFSDISTLFLEKAEENFSEYSFMKYMRLDIEEGVETHSDIVLNQFDFVFAANVLHATKDMSKTLNNVHALLKPNGALIMLEGLKHRPWLDITFGLTKGWWLFKDQYRGPDGPLLTYNQWKKALNDSGFEDSIRIDDAGMGLDYSIILANNTKNEKNNVWILIGLNNSKVPTRSLLSETLLNSGKNCIQVNPGDLFEIQEISKDVSDKKYLYSEISLNYSNDSEWTKLWEYIFNLKGIDQFKILWMTHDGIEISKISTKGGASRTTENIIHEQRDNEYWINQVFIRATHCLDHSLTKKIDLPNKNIRTSQNIFQWVITQNLFSPIQESSYNIYDIVNQLNGASLCGLVRSIDLEKPDLIGGLIDLQFLNDKDYEYSLDTLISLIENSNQEDPVHTQFYLRSDEKNKEVKIETPELEQYSKDPDPKNYSSNTNGLENPCLVIGGTGALGRATVEYLCNNKVMDIYVTSRSEPSNELKTYWADTEKAGTHIHWKRLDLEDYQSVCSCLQDIHADFPILGQVFMCAGIGDSGKYYQNYESRLSKQFSIKIEGAHYILDALYHIYKESYGQIIFYSSMTSVFGASLQSAYCSGSSYLDALGKLSPKIKVINWGPFSGGGLIPANEYVNLDSMGLRLFSLSDFGNYIDVYFRKQISKMKKASTRNVSLNQNIIAAIDWKTYLTFFDYRKKRALFNNQRNAFNTAIPQKTISATTGNNYEFESSFELEDIMVLMQKEIAKILRYSNHNEIDINIGFFDMGLDSLSIMKLKTKIENIFNLKLSVTIGLEYPNIFSLGNFVKMQLENIVENEKKIIDTSSYEPEDVKMDLHSLNAGEQQDEIEMILSEVTEIESLLKK